jgi:hypothetical protein
MCSGNTIAVDEDGMQPSRTDLHMIKLALMERVLTGVSPARNHDLLLSETRVVLQKGPVSLVLKRTKPFLPCLRRGASPECVIPIPFPKKTVYVYAVQQIVKSLIMRCTEARCSSFQL